MNDLQKIANRFITFEDLFYEIFKKGGIENFSYCMDNDGKWKRLEFKWMLEHFKSKGDDAKCKVLEELIATDYEASPEKQIELNNKLAEKLLKCRK